VLPPSRPPGAGSHSLYRSVLGNPCSVRRADRRRSCRIVHAVAFDDTQNMPSVGRRRLALSALPQHLGGKRLSYYGPDGGSGASGDFGREKGRWRTEDRQAAKHKCLISGRFPSLTRVTGHVSAPDEGLLSADAPEPVQYFSSKEPLKPLTCQDSTGLFWTPAPTRLLRWRVQELARRAAILVLRPERQSRIFPTILPFHAFHPVSRGRQRHPGPGLIVQ
jgi:hypothetical protein